MLGDTKFLFFWYTSTNIIETTISYSRPNDKQICVLKNEIKVGLNPKILKNRGRRNF